MSKQAGDPLDQFIRQQVEGCEIEPSAGVWKGIERQLDRESDVKRNIRFARWSVAASVLICMIAGVFYFSPKNNNTNVIAEQAPVKRDAEHKIVEPSAKKEVYAQVEKERSISAPGHSIPVIVKKQIKKRASGQADAPVQVIEQAEVPVNEPEQEEIPLLARSDDRPLSVPESPDQLAANKKQLQVISGSIRKEGSKTVVNDMADVVNYVAKKITKEEIIQINKRSIDTNTNVMSYNIDLGFFKISRVKHQSN